MTASQQRDVDTPVGPRRYIDGTYAAATEGWHDEDAPHKAGWAAQFLRENQVVPKSLCDVGCGAGGVLDALGAVWPDAKLVGFDISPDAVRLARDLHPRVDVRLGDATQCSEAFDLVLMMDVFEHVEDYLGFLRKASQLGRQYLFHIPLDMTALMVMREHPILAAREHVGHLHYFSKATANATLVDAGYVVHAMKYTAGTLELPNPTVRMRLAKWPRKLGFYLAPDLTARVLGGFSLLVLASPRVVT